MYTISSKKVSYEVVMASSELPKDNKRYLFFDTDSTDRVEEAYLTIEEAEPLIGFLYNAWLKPVFIHHEH